MSASDDKYNRSPKGRARNERHDKTEKRRISHNRYGDTLKGMLADVRDVAKRRTTR